MALALAMASVLLVRPICGTLLTTSGNVQAGLSAAHQTNGQAHAGHGSHGSNTCCTSIGDGAPFAPLMLNPAAGADGVLLALAGGFSFLVGTGFLPLGVLRFANAPPDTRPYYARSARIQR